MQIKLSNFKMIGSTGSGINSTDYAEVDVEITKGFWPFKTKHTEHRKICSPSEGHWFFLDTGEFTPNYQAETLYRAYIAKENLKLVKDCKIVSEQIKPINEVLESFAELPEGWNGYTGAAPNNETIAKAKEIASLLSEYSWQAVPGEDGSIQLECHTADYDIEIYVSVANENIIQS